MWKENNDLMRFQISPALFGRDLKNVSHKQVGFGERVKKKERKKSEEKTTLLFSLFRASRSIFFRGHSSAFSLIICFPLEEIREN